MILDAAFAEARNATPLPSDAFLSSLIAQAEDVQKEFAQPHVTDQPATSAQSVFDRVRAGLRSCRLALGGWTGLAGLATACAAGIWIGVAPPANLPDFGELMFSGVSDVSVFSDGYLMAEFAYDEG